MQLLTNLDLAKNELQNARIHNLTSAPTLPELGQAYLDTVAGKVYVCINKTGPVWLELTNTYDMGNNTLLNVGDPVNSTDAANKRYVDAARAGLLIKDPVRLATAAALPAYTASGSTLTATATGTLTVDGQVVALGDRILVKDESTTANNGVYVCTTAGAVGVAYVLTRASDFDNSSTATVVQGTGNTTNANATVSGLSSAVVAQLQRGMTVTGSGIPANAVISTIASTTSITLSANATATASGVTLTFGAPEVREGSFVYVDDGSANAGSQYVLTTADPITVGTTGLTFTKYSGAGTLTASNPLSITGTTISWAPGRGTTAGSILRSGGSGADPSWSTATYPSTVAVNQLLFASVANAVTGLATANSSVLVTNSSGVPSWGTVLPSGTKVTKAGAATPPDVTLIGKQSFTITGTGAVTSFTVTHNLHSNIVGVWIYDSTGQQVIADVNVTTTATTDSLTVTFGTAPANGVTYTVVVIG